MIKNYQHGITLRAALFILIIVISRSYNVKSYHHLGALRPLRKNFHHHDSCTRISAFNFPWDRSKDIDAKILLTLQKIEADVKKIDADIKKIDADIQTTKTNIMSVLTGITIAVAVIGGTKTVFESIEYIPTIPSKISKIVQEEKSKNFEQELKFLKNELRDLQQKK